MEGERTRKKTENDKKIETEGMKRTELKGERDRQRERGDEGEARELQTALSLFHAQ